jgi:hypothetical protein
MMRVMMSLKQEIMRCMMSRRKITTRTQLGL